MGREVYYQAIPDDAVLLKRAKAEPYFNDYLVPWKFRDPANCIQRFHEAEDADFCGELQKLVAEHPGLETRNYTLDRWDDKVLYIISEERRLGISDASDIGTRAVRGSEKMAPHLINWQWLPIRHSTAAQTAEIADWLSTISISNLKTHFDLQKMHEKGVYKAFANREPEWEWQWIVEHFEGLVKFYRQVANHYEGVIVMTV